MAGTWLGLRSALFFFGQNFRIFAQKSVFCYRTPDFVNGPFLALGDSFDLAPSDPFLNFSFPSYVNFREGENGDFRARGHWEKLRNSETKSLKIDPKVPNRPSRKGLH